LIVPVLVAVHIFFWPWLAPFLIGMVLLTCLGLWLAYPKIMAAENEG
jgi:hypothetical protein